MEIKITIDSCSDCKHSDHTGAFTPGGALRCCQHSNSPKNFCMEKHTGRKKDENYKIAKIDCNIPTWCPLKKFGTRY